MAYYVVLMGQAGRKGYYVSDDAPPVGDKADALGFDRRADAEAEAAMANAQWALSAGERFEVE